MKKSVTFVKTLALTLALGFVPVSVMYSQGVRNSENVSTKDLPSISFSSDLGNFDANFSGKDITTSFLTSHLQQWFGANNDHTFVFVKEKTDELNIKRSEFQHYYKGVKVADELIFIHEKAGKVVYVNGEFTKNINLSISQPLEKNVVESIISEDMKSSKITYSDLSQVITKVKTEKGVETHLVSQIDAAALSEMKAYTYFIDNSTKKIVKKLSKIFDHHENFNSKKIIPKIGPLTHEEFLQGSKTTFFLDTPSTSTTYYKGNQPITVDSYNGSFRLKDNTRNIHTQNGTGWDGNGTAAGGLTGTITEYTNATANFTAVETKAPVEVHWAMKTAYDYYMTRHNRNSYDGSGSIIRNYYNINFGTTAAPSGANAAAVDVQGIVAMVYGNGFYANTANPTTNLNYFSPFVGIDVAGHEYSHLMVSRTANLAYQGESGALNESFADMFGAAIEFYSNISPNWTIGEGIPNPGLGALYLRSMSSPNAGNNQIGGQQPDTYQGTYWGTTVVNPSDPNNDHGSVHKNSGVGNYWFYLLSQGGSGTNDINHAYNVTGITIQKAEKIAYRTLANYLTANSQYINAYTSSKQAAIDLYGANTNELQQVENAWCAVGIGNCANLLAVNESIKIDSDNIKIYPNPVKNGQFTIDSNIKGNAEFEIYDVSGKLINKSKKLEKGVNQVNIIGAETGVYLVKINAGGNVITKKVINK